MPSRRGWTRWRTSESRVPSLADHPPTPSNNRSHRDGTTRALIAARSRSIDSRFFDRANSRTVVDASNGDRKMPMKQSGSSTRRMGLQPRKSPARLTSAGDAGVGCRSRTASSTASATRVGSSRTWRAQTGRVRIPTASQTSGKNAARARRTTTNSGWPSCQERTLPNQSPPESTKNRRTALPEARRVHPGPAGPGGADIARPHLSRIVSRFIGARVSRPNFLYRPDARSEHLNSSPWFTMTRSGRGSIVPT